MRTTDLVAALRMAKSNYLANGKDICGVAADHLEAMSEHITKRLREMNQQHKTLLAQGLSPKNITFNPMQFEPLGRYVLLRGGDYDGEEVFAIGRRVERTLTDIYEQTEEVEGVKVFDAIIDMPVFRQKDRVS